MTLITTRRWGEHVKEAKSEQLCKICEHPDENDVDDRVGDDDDNLKEAVAEQSCKISEHPDDDDVDVADRVGDGAGEDEEGERGQHSHCYLKIASS